MKFTPVQASKLARLARKHMKGRGFWNRLKKIGSSVLSKFTDVGNLQKIFLSPDVLTAAMEGLASGNPLEALGSASAVVAKNIALNVAQGITEGATGGRLTKRKSVRKSVSKSRSKLLLK